MCSAKKDAISSTLKLQGATGDETSNSKHLTRRQHIITTHPHDTVAMDRRKVSAATRVWQIAELRQTIHQYRFIPTDEAPINVFSTVPGTTTTLAAIKHPVECSAHRPCMACRIPTRSGVNTARIADCGLSHTLGLKIIQLQVHHDKNGTSATICASPS